MPTRAVKSSVREKSYIPGIKASRYLNVLAIIKHCLQRYDGCGRVMDTIHSFIYLFQTTEVHRHIHKNIHIHKNTQDRQTEKNTEKNTIQ